MDGKRLGERLRRHVDAQNEEINCFAVRRLVAFPDRTRDATPDFDIRLVGAFNGDRQNLLPLRGDQSLLLDVRQTVTSHPGAELNTLLAVAGYNYRLVLMVDGGPAEVIAFHWPPEAPPPQRRHPHMHVGSLVTAGSRLRPRDFNRLHIPTGPLSLEAVLLFAIEELGVEPARGRDRAAVTDQLRAGDNPARQSFTPLD